MGPLFLKEGKRRTQKTTAIETIAQFATQFSTRNKPAGKTNYCSWASLKTWKKHRYEFHKLLQQTRSNHLYFRFNLWTWRSGLWNWSMYCELEGLCLNANSCDNKTCYVEMGDKHTRCLRWWDFRCSACACRKRSDIIQYNFTHPHFPIGNYFKWYVKNIVFIIHVAVMITMVIKRS